MEADAAFGAVFETDFWGVEGFLTVLRGFFATVFFFAAFFGAAFWVSFFMASPFFCNWDIHDYTIFSSGWL